MLFEDSNITVEDVLYHDAIVNDVRLFAILDHFNANKEDRQKILDVVNNNFGVAWIGRVVIRMTSTIDENGFIIPMLEFRGIQNATQASSPVVDIYYNGVMVTAPHQWPALHCAIVMDSNTQFALDVEERKSGRITFAQPSETTPN